MCKHGSVVYKWHPCLPRGQTHSCIHAHHHDHSTAMTVFANGIYFVDMPHISSVAPLVSVPIQVQTHCTPCLLLFLAASYMSISGPKLVLADCSQSWLNNSRIYKGKNIKLLLLLLLQTFFSLCSSYSSIFTFHLFPTLKHPTDHKFVLKFIPIRHFMTASSNPLDKR